MLHAPFTVFGKVLVRTAIAVVAIAVISIIPSPPFASFLGIERGNGLKHLDGRMELVVCNVVFS